MAINFYPVLAKEHELGVYLGTLESTFKRAGSFELYFPDQADYLALVNNDLYLSSDWQFDFETQNLFTVDAEGNVPFREFVGGQTPIKFVYED